MGNFDSESWYSAKRCPGQVTWTDSDMTPASSCTERSFPRSLGHWTYNYNHCCKAAVSFRTNMWSSADLRPAANAVAIQSRGVTTQLNNTGAPRAAVANVSVSVLQCIPPNGYIDAAHAMYVWPCCVAMFRGWYMTHRIHRLGTRFFGWCCVGPGNQYESLYVGGVALTPAVLVDGCNVLVATHV